MGKATGLRFEDWLGSVPVFWAFMNEDRISVTGRNDADDGTNAAYTKPNGNVYAAYTKPNGNVVEFTIPDSVHNFAEATGRNDFRRFALFVGKFLAQGGNIEDVTDPFHEDDE